MWLELHVSGQDKTMCFCEPAGCIEGGNVLDYLRNYQLPKKTVLHGMFLGFTIYLLIYLLT